MAFGCVPVVGMGLMWPKGRDLTLNRSYRTPSSLFRETEVVCSLTYAQLTLRPPPDTLRQGYALVCAGAPRNRSSLSLA